MRPPGEGRREPWVALPMSFFLDPERADEHGLVGVGGDLRPEHLLLAYRRGIFPWYDETHPIYWWSPDPRAIFEMDSFHVSRRLRRTIRSGRFQVSMDRDFAGVIRGCAARAEGTWITADMIAAYEQLHHLGFAHSIETWADGELVGGVYGIAMGGFFAGESMFHRVTDASKVALTYLMAWLRQRGYLLFDTQMVTEHTMTLGAIEIPRSEYLARLRKALKAKVTFR